MNHNVYLGLGSNEGDRAELLERAISLLALRAGIVVTRSSVIETEPWGFVSEHQFLNMVVAIQTSLSPTRLLDVTQRIERQLGRRRNVSEPFSASQKAKKAYADRPIDIDILLFDNRIIHTSRLDVPHPLMLQREFVWRPLLEIAPDILWPPTGRPLRDELLLSSYPDLVGASTTGGNA